MPIRKVDQGRQILLILDCFGYLQYFSFVGKRSRICLSFVDFFGFYVWWCRLLSFELDNDMIMNSYPWNETCGLFWNILLRSFQVSSLTEWVVWKYNVVFKIQCKISLVSMVSSFLVLLLKDLWQLLWC